MLHSCTSQAVVGLIEFLLFQGCREWLDLSRLFLYKVTRRLLGWTGDTGATIRATIKATAAFGVPPESYWPYEIHRLDFEPDAFLYSFASKYTALKYARLDEYGITGAQTLDNVRNAILDGFPVAFGFPVYSSLNSTDPDVPVPDPDRDTPLGGHAVLAIGYDDNHTVDGVKTPSLIIRNSWGRWWGEDGYGYLPYQFGFAALASPRTPRGNYPSLIN